MSFCSCSMAGTSACKHCANNPNAEPAPFKITVQTETTTPYGGYPVTSKGTTPLNYENRVPWDEFEPEKIYFFDEQWAPINVSCPKCGNQIQRKEDEIITTRPPKRRYRCPVCGWQGVK